MYNYIKGTLVSVEPGKVVLENNGIGYELGVSGNTLADARNLGGVRAVRVFAVGGKDALYAPH